jgi:hypothetical protein
VEFDDVRAVRSKRVMHREAVRSARGHSLSEAAALDDFKQYSPHPRRIIGSD